jgi:outer membrane protein W
MIRRIPSLALGLAVALVGVNALAQEEGGEEAAPAEEAAPVEEAPAEEAAPAGEAAGGEAAVDTSAPPDTGGKIKLGLRLGYGIPMGDAAKDASLSDSVSGMIPIWLDLGYMVTPNIMVGLYGHYGIVMLNSDISDACDAADVDCSASSIRFGLQGQYHVSPGESVNPWFGLGIGYEMLNFKSPVGDANTTGFEFANLQAGADFAVADNIGLGPFASFSLGQFSSVEGEDIEEKAMHMWLVLGVRGMFGF